MRERDFACVLKNSLRFPRASAVKKLPMASTWKTRVNAFWREWGGILTAALLLTAAFRSAIADWNDVPSGSMEPTILIGDRIFVNKLAYDLKIPFTTRHLAQWNDPMRGDIVVFFSPENGKRLVKRVIGIPADEIALQFVDLPGTLDQLHVAENGCQRGAQIVRDGADKIALDTVELLQVGDVVHGDGRANPRDGGDLRAENAPIFHGNFGAVGHGFAA